MIIRADSIEPQPWKNGGGRTRELLASAPGPAGWQWRLSLADIDQDGPFSAFEGVQRWFAVVAGAGVELQFAERVRRALPAEEPIYFDGASMPACSLLQGPTRDLNLMLRGVHGVMRQAVPGQEWRQPWALRGRFDIASMSLHWGLPAGPLPCATPGYWIGINA